MPHCVTLAEEQRFGVGLAFVTETNLSQESRWFSNNKQPISQGVRLTLREMRSLLRYHKKRDRACGLVSFPSVALADRQRMRD